MVYGFDIVKRSCISILYAHADADPLFLWMSEQYPVVILTARGQEKSFLPDLFLIK